MSLATRLATGRDLTGEALRFGAIGVLSTVAYAALFLLLRGPFDAALANALALVLTALGNTAANRRFTFGVRGGDGLARDHVAGLTAFGVALAITNASLAGLAVLSPSAGRLAELLVLVAANATATVARFLLLRTFIRRPATLAAAGPGRSLR